MASSRRHVIFLVALHQPMAMQWGVVSASMRRVTVISQSSHCEHLIVKVNRIHTWRHIPQMYAASSSRPTSVASAHNAPWQTRSGSVPHLWRRCSAATAPPVTLRPNHLMGGKNPGWMLQLRLCSSASGSRDINVALRHAGRRRMAHLLPLSNAEAGRSAATRPLSRLVSSVHAAAPASRQTGP